MNCHDIRHLPQSRTRRRCKKLRQDGFTLVEILACTFLLGLLMVLLSPTIRDGYSAVTVSYTHLTLPTILLV